MASTTIAQVDDKRRRKKDTDAIVIESPAMGAGGVNLSSNIPLYGTLKNYVIKSGNLATDVVFTFELRDADGLVIETQVGVSDNNAVGESFLLTSYCPDNVKEAFCVKMMCSPVPLLSDTPVSV